jgi:CheY-like chemotaxis protein/ribosomal protein L40E
MKCPNCAQENPADFRFCGKCGYKLTHLCEICGFETPISIEFCGKCGAPLKQEQAPPKPLDLHEPLPPKIVVVDDEPFVTKLLKHLLETEGMSVHVANNAKEALALIEETHPSLVITDRMMPDMDGFELIKSLRKKPEFASLKIIMLTVVDTFEDIRKSVLIGADDYICKPFDPQELIWSVKRHLMHFHPWGKKKSS